jgi:hypothetical protein
MSSAPQERPAGSPERKPGFLDGFGLFTSILMALLVGVSSFFLITFLAIVGIAIYNVTGHSLNYADSYKLISFPAACVVLALSLIFFGALWLRRKLST